MDSTLIKSPHLKVAIEEIDKQIALWNEAIIYFKNSQAIKELIEKKKKNIEKAKQLIMQTTTIIG